MPKNAAARWSIYLAISMVFAITCGFLSHWQFTRMEERDTTNRLIAENYDGEPVPLDAVLAEGANLAPEDVWTNVTLTGSYRTDGQLLARNRPLGGVVAFEVLVPFETTDSRLILVDRGWVGPGEGDVPDAIPAAPEGNVTVVVRLKPGEPIPEGRDAPAGQVPTINLPFVAERSGYDIETGAYGQLVSEDPAPAEARPNDFERPSEDSGMNLSYAIQWILFAIMGFVFIFYMIRTEAKHRREDREDAAAVAAGERMPVRASKKRRRDADADAEDELLSAP